MTHTQSEDNMTSGWKTVKLGELITIKHGFAFKGEYITTEDNGIVLVTPGNFAIGGGFQEGKKFFNGEYPSDYVLRPGELIVTMTDLSKDGDTLGYSALVPETNRTYLHNQRIGLIEVHSNEISKDYLYWFMRTRAYQKQVVATASGSTVRHTSPSRICEIEIPLPPLDVQRRIAAVLKPLDDKIEINARINARLERAAQVLFKRHFVRFEPYGGTMPPGWRVGTLSEIAEFVGGYSYKSSELKESNTAMATIKNFDRKGGFKLDGFKELVPSAKIKQSQYAELFDTFVAHTDLTQNAEVVGNAEMLMSKAGYERIAFSMDLVKVVPKTPDISKFTIAALLRNSRFKAHCLHYVNGTTVLHLNKKALPEYKIALPDDLSELKQFDELITRIYKMIAYNTDESRTLARLRDVLLPRLMSGAVDVRLVRLNTMQEGGSR